MFERKKLMQQEYITHLENWINVVDKMLTFTQIMNFNQSNN